MICRSGDGKDGGGSYVSCGNARTSHNRCRKFSPANKPRAQLNTSLRRYIQLGPQISHTIASTVLQTLGDPSLVVFSYFSLKQIIIKFYNVTKGTSERSYRKRAPAVLLLLISINLEVQIGAREL